MTVTSMIRTIEDAGRALRAGTVTSTELFDAAQREADRHDGALGVYLARFDETARTAAATADAELASGIDRGPLHGVPLGIKDVVAAREGPTTAQSLVLDPAWGQGRDALVVERLRAAGAVLTGKTTTMEFAVGFGDPTKPFPVPRNPWNPGCWPGGSSSGSGIGVAAGMFLGAIGTDTGGSIRTPAAFCGVTGLMPTFSRVPTEGTVALAPSLDHVGPLARSAWDCAAILGAIAGPDRRDHEASGQPVPDYLAALQGDLAGLRVGVMTPSQLLQPSDAGVDACYDAAVAALTTLGAQVRDVTLPHFDEVTAATFLTMAAEGCALHQHDLQHRWDDYGAPTRGGVLAWGVLFSAVEYVQAQRVRRIGQLALARLFDELDVIVSPTFSMGAPTFARLEQEGLGALLGRSTTTYWDGVGNPVLAVPIGFTDDGLPLSMQLAGRPFDEATVLRAGHAFQSATDWHLRFPQPMEVTVE